MLQWRRRAGGRRGEAVGVRYVCRSISALQDVCVVFFVVFFPPLLLQLLFARITNHSLQRLLVTSSFLLITFGDAKLVN